MPHRPNIKPELLRWARLRAHLSEEQLASRLGFGNVDNYRRFEAGLRRPTQRQLRLIARAVERPIWFFFLDTPPDDEPEPTASFRKRPRHDVEISHEEVRAVREALRRRDLALEALDGLDEPVPAFALTATIQDDPEHIAARAREYLGVSLEIQLDWSAADDAYRQWRVAIERSGVLVFHFSLPHRSGFALVEQPFPIIAVSTSKEKDTAKQFTLMHELGHVILGDSMLHSLGLLVYRTPEEKWCNKFAGAMLVPEHALRQREEAKYYGSYGLWGESDVRRVARVFKVSPAVLVRRLERFNLIQGEVAGNLKAIFDMPLPDVPKKQAPIFYQARLASWGYFVPNIIFESYHRGAMGLVELTQAFRLSHETVAKYEHKLNERRLSAIS